MDTALALENWENEGGIVPVPVSNAPEDLDSDSMKMWKALHGAFDFFNDKLFQSRLDRNRIILNCSRKSRRTLGFFRPFGWSGEAKDQEAKAEISLNPDCMHDSSIDEIYAVLVHEMCHYEQELFGSPGKRGYHNKEWADMMDAVGLKPINVNAPAKRTGMRCSHQIIPDGVFDKAMKKIPEEFKLPFMGLKPPRTKSATGYEKWSCPECKQICRAKSNAKLACIPCTEKAVEAFEAGETDTLEMVKLEKSF